MRIAIYGVFRPPKTPAWFQKRPAVLLADAMERVGVDVVRVDFDTPQHSGKPTLSSDELADKCEGCDVLLLDLEPFAWDAVREAPHISLPPVALVTWEQLRVMTNDTIAAREWRHLDWAFLPDANDERQLYESTLGKNIVQFYCAAREEDFAVGKVVDEYAGKVVFAAAASPNYHYRWPFRAAIPPFLQHLYRDKFVHFDGHHLPLPTSYTPDVVASAAAFVVDYTGTGCDADKYEPGIVLPFGTPTRDGYAPQWHVGDRLFRFGAAGAVLVHPASPALDDMGFVDGVHLFTYQHGNLGSLQAAIDAALSLSPTASAAMRNATRDKIRASHTWEHRAKQIIDTITGKQ